MAGPVATYSIIEQFFSIKIEAKTASVCCIPDNWNQVFNMTPVQFPVEEFDSGKRPLKINLQQEQEQKPSVSMTHCLLVRI
jgi:hypothetical protein